MARGIVVVINGKETTGKVRKSLRTVRAYIGHHLNSMGGLMRGPQHLTIRLSLVKKEGCTCCMSDKVGYGCTDKEYVPFSVLAFAEDFGLQIFIVHVYGQCEEIEGGEDSPIMASEIQPPSSKASLS
jgi:hypothetical protein